VTLTKNIFRTIRDTPINALEYVDRCIHFATVLLASMFEDRTQAQKAEPQEWTQEFSHTINIMASFVQSNQIHDQTKYKIEQFKNKYNDIIQVFTKNRFIIMYNTYILYY